MSRAPSPCPICGKPAEQAARPFCSKRCADIDLAHWLGGSYRIATPLTGEDDAAALPKASPEDDFPH